MGKVPKMNGFFLGKPGKKWHKSKAEAENAKSGGWQEKRDMYRKQSWYEKLIFVNLRSFFKLKKWEIAYMA